MIARFPTLRLEGGLISSDQIDRVADQKAKEFTIDDIAAAWSDVRSYWSIFEKSLAKLPEDNLATSETRNKWMIPFFSTLGYDLSSPKIAVEVDGLTYAISHRAGKDDNSTPIHIVGFRQSLDRRPDSGRPRLAPHSLVQEYLNRTEHLWGVVTNGSTLRILRNSNLLRKQAYIEFDLEQIMRDELFADFALLFRLIHASRLPKGIDDASSCQLELFHKQTVEQGGRVRDHLRDGVEKALTQFGNGFLNHPRNAALRVKVQDKSLEPFEFYEQLLRLIYRFLFLMVSEERNLISDNMTYRQHYSISRIRRLVEVRAAYTKQEDLWLSLALTFKLFQDESLGPLLGVPTLNGDLFDPARTSELNEISLSNRDLLLAIWEICMYREKANTPWRRINYAALDVEELGSVYESLLDFHPIFIEQNGKLMFRLLTGTERKSTGSYYTPPELVNELIKSSLVPTIQDRLSGAKSNDERSSALLTITICDPACGSGHFLLAAARTIGRELAKSRTGDEEPASEQMRIAIRDTITHCIYGVDKNPLAVDLCKVALWLEGHTTAKPLTFLDHRIRCGDSLVGILDLSVLKDGIPDDAFIASAGDNKTVARNLQKQNKMEREHRNLVEFDTAINVLTSSRQQVNAIADDKPADIRKKKELFCEFQKEGTPWCKDKTACDLWTAAFFVGITSEQYQDQHIPTTQTVREYIVRGASVDLPQVRVARQLAMEYRFFHWALEFPEVFANGGFDCVLGNPPWEKEKIMETEFFSTTDLSSQVITTSAHRKQIIQNGLTGGEKAGFIDVKGKLEKIKSFFKSSSRFKLTGHGEMNTYALFTELFNNLLNHNGQAGIITQTSLFTNDTFKKFFIFLLEQQKLVKIVDFWNIKKIFPSVKPTVKFALITLKFKNKGGIRVFCHLEKIIDLQDKWREFILLPEDIKIVNPNTLTLPMFRSSKDAEKIIKIYKNNKILKNDSCENEWNIKYATILHMTNDSHFFHTKEELEHNNATEIGNHFIKEEIEFLPIYESKLMQQFNHRHATFDGIPIEERFKTKARTNKPNLSNLQDPHWLSLPRYWIEKKDLLTKYPSEWNYNWFVGFRNAISSSGDARSSTFCIIPYAGVGNSMPILIINHPICDILFLLANFNSLVFDYVLKQKVSGGNLNLFILNQLPLVSIQKCTREDFERITPKVVELCYSAWDLKSFAQDILNEIGVDSWNRWFPSNPLIDGRPQPFVWNDEWRAILRAELDACFAKMYGLNREELEYILGTFPVLQKSEEGKYGEYRTRKLVLKAWEDMEKEGKNN
jgi:hypothetical protein